MKTLSSVIVGCFVSCMAINAQATLLTFDDVQDNTQPGTNIAPARDVAVDYQGLTWTNWMALDPSQDTTGYYTSGIIGDNVANVSGTGFLGTLSYFNSTGQIYSPTATIESSSVFTFTSAWFNAHVNDGMTITVKGFLAGAQTYTTSFTVDTNAPIKVQFDWANIDMLTFDGSGGANPNPPNSVFGTARPNFNMDDFCINGCTATPHPDPVPEPSSLILAGSGLMALVARRRRRTV